MITTSQLETYKKIIGSSYSRKIVNFFKERKYRKLSGKDYTTQDIRNFFGGRRTDKKLLIYILESVEHYKILNEKIENKSNKILSTKKPEAITPGNSHN